MIIAAIGAIDGNLPALDAVLGDVRDAGIHAIVNVGDSVPGYPWPNEVIARLKEHNIQTVQGARDRMVVRIERKGLSMSKRMDSESLRSIEWAHRALSSDNIEALSGWPKRHMVSVDGISICVCHGAPSSQSEELDSETSETRLRREREVANTNIIVCGLTPNPFSRWIDDTLFVNPGRVGVPTKAPGVAVYATISTEEEPWQARIHKVKYDGELVERRMRDEGLTSS